MILIQDCMIAQEGMRAFNDGKDASDNPYMSGHHLPYEEANKWTAGYVTRQLIASGFRPIIAALLLGNEAWALAGDHEAHSRKIAALNLLVKK